MSAAKIIRSNVRYKEKTIVQMIFIWMLNVKWSVCTSLCVYVKMYICFHEWPIQWSVATSVNFKLEFYTLTKQIKSIYFNKNGTVRASASKTKDINKYAVPRNVKEVQRFLGFAGYLRKFIENYIIEKPLSDLTRKNAKFYIRPQQQKSFEQMKK